MNARTLEAVRPPEMQGRRALVTGAGSGIGLAVACALAAQGAAVAGVVQHKAQAETLRHHLPDAAVFVQDLLDDAATAALPHNDEAVPPIVSRRRSTSLSTREMKKLPTLAMGERSRVPPDNRSSSPARYASITSS